jgi:hypothetical protein
MMLDRLLALAAFAVLAGFLGILMWKVPHWDLIAVCAAALLMAGGDFIAAAVRRNDGHQ